MTREAALDTLLDLDGQLLVVDPESRYWVQFVVKRVAPTESRPHGLAYSLTLHGPDGERLVGFDNAHPIKVRSGPSNKGGITLDHQHRRNSVRPYRSTDAATLLADFWTVVDAVLRERGILP